MTEPRYRRRRRSSPSRTALLERAGVRDDIARDVADVLVDGDLLGHTTHGLALLAPYLARDREGRDGEGGRAVDRQRAPGRADVGRRTAAGAVAHAARARRRGGDGGDARHRHRRHPPLASHRVPRRLPEARDRARPGGDRAVLRSDGRRASRRSAASRRSSRRIRSPPAFRRRAIRSCSTSRARSRAWASRSQQTKAGEKLPASVGAGRAGQCDRRSGACCSPSPRARCCRSAASTPATRASALALLVEALTAGSPVTAAPIRPKAGAATVFVQVLDPAAFGGARRRSSGRWITWSTPRTRRSRAPGVDARAAAGRGGHGATARAARARRRALSDDHAGARAVGGEARRAPMPR